MAKKQEQTETIYKVKANPRYKIGICSVSEMMNEHDKEKFENGGSVTVSKEIYKTLVTDLKWANDANTTISKGDK